MTTASKITLVRVVLIPVYMVLMLLSAGGAEWLRWAAVAVFIIASVSDFLDGYIARHYNQVSDFGKFLDPLADKLLVTACMMIFVGWGRMPSWLVFIVIAREFAISGLRMVAANNGHRRRLERQDQDLLHHGRSDRHDGPSECAGPRYGRERGHPCHDGVFRRRILRQELALPWSR